MFYIPKGKPMHEKLSTSFVRMDGLLEELRAEGFNGYIALNFAETGGLLLIHRGQIISAVEVSGHERHSGPGVKEELFRLAERAKGAVSVYHLQEEIVVALAGIAEGETVYANLSSDFASLGKLIRKLAGEQRLHFISLVFADRAEDGGLIYVDGDVTEAACTAGGVTTEGAEGVSRLIEESEKRLAVFNVYREAAKAELPNFDEKEVELSINRVTAQAAEPQPAASQPVPQPATPPAAREIPAPARVAEPPHPEATPAAGHAASEPKAPAPARALPELITDDILEVVDLESPFTPAKSTSSPAGNGAGSGVANGKTAHGSPTLPGLSPAQVTPAPFADARPSQGGGEMRELTELMSVVVAAVERGMTVAGRGSSFPTALRAGLLAVTERYPFLDPFAAEFEYHDREIVFVGSAQPSEFAIGLTEALRQMVEDLIYSSNGRVRDYIAEELRKVEREHEAEIRRFNLGNLTERVCQH